MSTPQKLKEVLATANMIRLKKGKHYLLVVGTNSGINKEELLELMKLMEQSGFHSIAVYVDDVNSVKVVEDES